VVHHLPAVCSETIKLLLELRAFHDNALILPRSRNRLGGGALLHSIPKL
jgi:hypothetical protein